MATYYVGTGGNNANAGTSWTLRKLTLAGAEAVPVTAGDTVYVGPGVYRELLTVNVSGTSGNPITYIADVTGANTDGVGGAVRITGSDNDQTATRANCITATTKNYRTFRGFTCDYASNIYINATTSCTNWIIEDCSLQGMPSTIYGVSFDTNTTNNTVRRCFFWPGDAASDCVQFNDPGSQRSDTANVVENCILIAGRNGFSVSVNRIGGVTIRNCLMAGGTGVSSTNLAAGQTTTVTSSLLYACATALTAGSSGMLTEDYNSLFGNATARTNVTTGTNSVAYYPIHEMPRLVSGLMLPWQAFGLSEWSAVRALADTGNATDDLFGRTRPVTSGKRTWGPFSAPDISRSSTQAHAGTYSLKLADAGRVQFFVPVTNVSTVFSCYVYREAGYTGTNPQMVIKQPGQADTTVTDAGSSGGWNLLTTTLTPTASPGYVVVEIVSNNTAASGSFNIYVDDLAAA